MTTPIIKNLTISFRCPTSERVVYSYSNVRDFAFAENKDFLTMQRDKDVIMFPAKGYIIEVTTDE